MASIARSVPPDTAIPVLRSSTCDLAVAGAEPWTKCLLKDAGTRVVMDPIVAFLVVASTRKTREMAHVSWLALVTVFICMGMHQLHRHCGSLVSFASRLWSVGGKRDCLRKPWNCLSFSVRTGLSLYQWQQRYVLSVYLCIFQTRSSDSTKIYINSSSSFCTQSLPLAQSIIQFRGKLIFCILANQERGWFGIVSRLWAGRQGFHSRLGKESLSRCHRVQTGSEAHLASYPMCIGDFFPVHKAAGAWS
jgi:hypothetical protein